jgi:AcrR family transcriptional regulator
MSTSPAPRWQRLEHDERRRQILLVARRLFSEESYDAVSTSEIAQAAGVARGLLHHYFGTKRELYLEVVRTLMRMPSNPVPPERAGQGLQAMIDASVDRWLEMLAANRGTWLAAIGARGLGRDSEVEAILEQAREQASDRLVDAVCRDRGIAEAPPALRAAVRAYGGFAEAASVQWLERERLTREQLRALLVDGFLAITGPVLRAVHDAV